MKSFFERHQRGGMILGVIVGLLLGLGIALAIALYIAKVPAPFVDKVPHRTPEQDAQEMERNKNWDPNAPLAGKQPIRPVAASGAEGASAPATSASAPAKAAASAPAADKRTAADAAAPARSDRDPASILAGNAAPAPAKPAASSTAAAQDPFVYYLQAGAYSSADDAEQQRARLALNGLVAKVTEREQGGRTVYRVRLGPFDARDDADATLAKVRSAGADAVLVRVDRTAR